MKKQVIHLIISFLILLSCKTENTPYYNDIKLNYKYEVQTDFYYSHFGIYHNGRYVYFPSGDNNSASPINESKFFLVNKLDLETGEIVWKTENINDVDSQAPVLLNGKIYIPSYDNYLYCFDDADGTLLASIKLSDDKEIAIDLSGWSANIVTDGKRYLFWPNKGDFCAITRLDTFSIDFKKKPDQFQVADVENLSCPENSTTEDYVANEIICDGESIYFETIGSEYDKRNTKVGSYDVQTGKLNWIQTVIDSYWNCGDVVLFLNGNNLYFFMEGVACYDKNSGREIFRNIQSKDKYYTEVINEAASMSQGVFLYKNRFYSTTNAKLGSPSETGYPASSFANVKEIDPKTGKITWSDFIPLKSTMHSRPIVIKNKMFITTWGYGIYVYDVESKKCLGRDTTYLTDGLERNIEYNGMFYTFCSNSIDGSNPTSTLVCVEP